MDTNSHIITKLLTAEIFSITGGIQNRFPELYALLDETPMLPAGNHAGININDYALYLESISSQLAVFNSIEGLSANV